jgi:hypothetical protein
MKNKKEISELNNTLDQTDLTNTSRIFYPTATEYTFLKNPQNFLQKTAF